jgi:hypothetical protein
MFHLEPTTSSLKFYGKIYIRYYNFEFGGIEIIWETFSQAGNSLQVKVWNKAR